MRPFTHAALAALYILSIVGVVHGILGGTKEDEIGLLTPIAALSLLVLSVSVMAYLFFYRPVTLYIEGSKKEAVSFFLTTVAAFAGFVLVVLGIILVL